MSSDNLHGFECEPRPTNTDAPLPWRPEFRDNFPSISDESWYRINTAFDDPSSMEFVDWTDKGRSVDLGIRLTRLASIKANVPANNRILQKDQHNITLENYKKLALETAGDLPNKDRR